jgi:serine/threonine protein phosphatase PrpC
MLQSGDVILLCSDGLYKALEDELIVEVVKSALPNVQLAANRLIDATLAKKVNQQDNVSVVLLQYL